MKAPFFVADDLSGATEVGACYCRAGWPVVLPLSLEAADRWPDEAVIGFSTESRNLPAEEAGARVEAAVRCALAQGRRLDFKKIDSTMRGSPGAELAAIARLLPDAHLLVTPANPAMGRAVRDGVLRVHGTPVAETEFGRDPASPVRSSEIATLLRLPPALAVRRLPLEQVRAGEAGCQRWLEQMAAQGIRAVISDAESAADLVTLARAGRAAHSWLLVGAGALAAAAAQAKVSPSGGRSRPAAPVGHITLFVCGSAHPVNRAQARALAHHRGVKTVSWSNSAPMADTVSAVVRVLESTRCGVMMAEPSPAGARADPRAVLDRLVTAVAAVDARVRLDRLFITGGESAHAICRRLGGIRLTLIREVEPGVVLAALDAPGGRRLLGTKPGGFGDEQTWVRVLDSLKAVE